MRALRNDNGKLWPLGLAYVVCALAIYAGLRSSGHPGITIGFDAAAAAWLARERAVSLPQALIVVLVAALLVNALAWSGMPSLALCLALVSALLIVCSAAVLRLGLRVAFPDTTVVASIVTGAILGLAMPALTAVLDAVLINLYAGIAITTTMLPLWIAGVLGFLVFAPSILNYQSRFFARFVRRRFVVGNVALAIISLAALWIAFTHIAFPFVIISVPLVFAAYRLGAPGAALLGGAAALFVSIIWLSGIRPIGASAGYFSGLASFPILALAAAVLPPIILGVDLRHWRSIAQSVRIKERLYRESIDHSPIGMAIVDLDGNWQVSNVALRQLLGIEEDELPDHPPLELIHPDDRADAQSNIAELLAGTAAVRATECRYRRSDGQYVRVLAAVSVARDDHDRPLHFVLQMESLEARRQAEQRLAEERERLKITLGAISESVITTDAAAVVTWMNSAAEALLGHDLERAISRPLHELLTLTNARTSAPVHWRPALAAVQTSSPELRDTSVLHFLDGRVVYVRERVSSIFGADGAVAGMVMVLRDVSASYARDREIAHQATHDMLTGCGNRFDFQERLGLAFRRAQQFDEPVCLCVIDLDRFKEVNDTGGHAAGDAMLRGVASAISACMRTSDRPSRIGGDEFAVILERCPLPRATRLAAAIVDAVITLRVEHNGKAYSVGASVGVAALTPQMRDTDAWIAAADAACYSAKRGGGNEALCAMPAVTHDRGS